MTSVGITPTQGFVIKYLSDTLKKMKSHYPIVYVKMYCLIMRSTSWIFNHQRQRKLEMIVFKGSASKAADASQNCFPSPAVSPVLKKKNRVLPTACPRRCPRVKETVRSRTDVVTGLQHQRAAKETGEVSAEPTKYFNI